MRVLRAKFVAPIASPMIENGFVAIDGDRLVDFGRFKPAVFAAESVEDLGEVFLLPGLVNAHTHLELSHVTRGPPPTSLGAWLGEIVAQRSASTPTEIAQVAGRAAMDGARESLRCGVTTVGDISRESAATRSALAGSPLNVVSFGEVQAMAQRRGLLEDRLAVAIGEASSSERLTIGVSPHAPYTVELDAYRYCVQVARERRLPICTHLAESSEEAEFLAQHTGPLRNLWDGLGAWDADVPRWSGSPIQFAKEVGLLDVAALLAHVNYLNDDDLNLLADSSASVVWCPRTHAYFGHVPHRWRDMRARGINVCIGTDSRASAPDLNVLNDARLVHAQSPDTPAIELFEMMTTCAARALHRTNVGAIAAGHRADLAAFPVRGDGPLLEILEEITLPTFVMVGGRKFESGIEDSAKKI